MIKLKGGLARGIVISQWLKDQGLVHERDYTWCRGFRGTSPDTKDVLIFEFNDPKWESVVALKWL